MTDLPDDDRDLFAAEYVLGLLDADGVVEAEARLRAEPGFRAAVAAWETRLAPLAETAPSVAPGEGLRARIMALALAANDESPLPMLERSRRRWRGAAAGMSAVAAALLLVVGWQSWRVSPVTQPLPPIATADPARPVLVASLSSADSQTSLAVAYDPREGALLVSPGQVQPAAGHDHELWIIPEGGAPASLGLIRAGTSRRVDVPGALAPHFRRDATVALSVEPTGGSPTGQPTGALLASGKLNEI